MSEDKTLRLLPGLDDLFGAGVAAGIAFFRKKDSSNAAVEQLLSALAGHNIAQFVDITDNMQYEGSIPITESDVMTGAVRGGWAMYRNRSNNEALMNLVGGALSQSIGRQLRNSVMPKAS
jgi:hypothetical protein